MKTFGELVTQIKSALDELSRDLLIPGGSQALGPAHAYGKSYLIRHSVRQLQEAVQRQEAQLQSLVGHEGTPGSTHSSDPRLSRVVDSIFQSLALIDRYIQDPSRYTHQGLAEWLKLEGMKCGLDASFTETSETADELNISANGFTLVLILSGQDSVQSASLVLIGRSGNHRQFELPDIVKYLEAGNKAHVSHLLSMASRLDLIESEGPCSLIQTVLAAVGAASVDELPYKVTLGGLKIPFLEGYEAILTFDSFDQPGESNRLAVVVDPPIIFPISQLRRLSSLCGVQVGAEPAVASSISQMLGLAVDVVRKLDERAVRLLLNDESVSAIMVARVPIARLDNLPGVVDVLRKAAAWCGIIQDAFSVKDDAVSTISIDVAPVDDFSIGITFWVRDSPDRLNVAVDSEGFLLTENAEFNARLGGPTKSFPDIIAHVIK
jgi:hypothetical protein